MTLRTHELSFRRFDHLAAGGGGVDGVRALVAARRSRTLMEIRLASTMDQRARRAYDVLARLMQRVPAVVVRVLDDPLVGAWATRAVLDRMDEQVPAAGLAFVAAAAAVRAGESVELDLPAVERSVLPSLGCLSGPVGGPVRTDHLTWRPFPRVEIDGGPTFVVVEWPAELLPEGLAQTTTFDQEVWSGVLRMAWRLLWETDSRMAAEVREMVTSITPMPGVRQANSATVADAIGCVFLTGSQDPEWVAVTLVHEVQHAKLAALTDMYPLIRPEGVGRYYAPWREDPRPAVGMLHGVYAFLGVTRFWRRRRGVAPSEHADREFVRWRAATFSAACALSNSPDLTVRGRRFVNGIARELWRWNQETAPLDVIVHAARESSTHRARWVRRHGLGDPLAGAGRSVLEVADGLADLGE